MQKRIASVFPGCAGCTPIVLTPRFDPLSTERPSGATGAGSDLRAAMRIAQTSNQHRQPGLLDIPKARRWFEIIRSIREREADSFALPYTSATNGTARLGTRDVVAFSSYSYLGLATHPRVLEAATRAIARYGSSTGGVRLLTGTLDLHLEFESRLAAFLGWPRCVTFSSGYAANLAAISALFGEADLCLLDRYAHQSLVAGVRLSGAQLAFFPHNDLVALEQLLRTARCGPKPPRRVLVVVDGVFSMDGDQAPLAELIKLKSAYGAFLLVDDSHGIAAVGAGGRGSIEAQGIDPSGIDLLTGALSKGIPSTGGFIAASDEVCEYLHYSSGPFIFSAAANAASVAAAQEALAVIVDEPWHLERLRANTRILRDGLRARGFTIVDGTSPIVPLMLGDFGRACQWSACLLEQGIAASAVGWPAVPVNEARLRLCATAAHRAEHHERLFAALELCRECDRLASWSAGA